MAMIKHGDPDAMHVVVKRRNQTFFFLVRPEEKLGTIVSMLAKVLSRKPDTMKLVFKDMQMDPDASLKDQQVTSGSVLELLLKIEGREDFEDYKADDLVAAHAAFQANSGSS
eukprot:CAMPEP_0204324514 /NCGR_PEP_ID=MMETSP0469-20131031/10291_1 /ASSEMBLY_ACC=CAM_ASM_000384 /TAXON_ID=2969 /ORGANISM="Oxyrrhis marina" /LENGTH=111 /DNA_ID=CAMNT_0051306189 /DNA_START=28 /DNA_END=363 /DNA_ORIENTATION=-